MRIVLFIRSIFVLVITLKECDMKGGAGYCSFPSYVWRTKTKDEGVGFRQWISRTEYFRNTDTWKKQKVIVAMETEILVRNKMHAHCSGFDAHGPVPCFRQEIHHRILCISEEPNDKFRTQINLNGKLTFSCIRFIRRSASAIQVYQAVPKDINEDRLCHNVSLQRNEWPWLDPYVASSQPCSVSGGFEFRSYLGENRQRICSSEGRLSRLESECLTGEGLLFQFPEEECSPFEGFNAEQRLFCSTEWVEESFVFLVLMDDSSSQLPRYVMRLPRSDQNWTMPFIGLLYFSIVAPLSGRGNPPGSVMFVEMEMIRSNDVTSSVRRPDCQFPLEFLGHWVSFDLSTMTQFLIEPGQLSSKSPSSVGTLICKIKHWAASSFYKVVAVRHNGCRPRYCCMQLSLRGDVIQYRLSGCSRQDESFDSCHVGRGPEVDGDPTPSGRRKDDMKRIRNEASVDGGTGKGGGGKRSVSVSSLLPMSSVQLSSCGLDGLFGADVTFSDGVRCIGTLDDRDVTNNTCTRRPTIRFNMAACIYDTPALNCIATVHLSTGNRLLITEWPDGDLLWCCWIVQPAVDSSSRSNGGSLRREIFVLHRCKCNTGEIINRTTAGVEPATDEQPPQMNVIKIYHYESDVCDDQRGLELRESSSDSRSLTVQSKPDATHNLNSSGVEGQAHLHDFDALLHMPRRRKEHKNTENDKSADTNRSSGRHVTIRYVAGEAVLGFAIIVCFLVRPVTLASHLFFDCKVT